MAATRANVNWKDVAFGTLQIDRVTSVSVAQNAENITLKADDAVYDEVIVNVNNRPMITIQSADTGTIMGIVPGSAGTVTATHIDAKKQVGGDVIYEMDAIAESPEASGSHAAFGTAQCAFRGVSPDGFTNPLAFSRNLS